MSDNSYILEYYVIGNMSKVTAICPNTLIEACVIVPSNIPQSLMNKQAINKLEYIKSKKFS